LRLLVISSLAATLAGCAYVAPQDVRQLSLTSEGVGTVAKKWQGPSQPRIIDSEGTLKTRTKNAKSNIVPASLSLQHNKSNAVINTKTDIVMNTKPPQSTQSDNKPNVAEMEPPQATQPDNKSNVVINTKPNIVTSMAPSAIRSARGQVRPRDNKGNGNHRSKDGAGEFVISRAV
jgi:hypothetical protein